MGLKRPFFFKKWINLKIKKNIWKILAFKKHLTFFFFRMLVWKYTPPPIYSYTHREAITLEWSLDPFKIRADMFLNSEPSCQTLIKKYLQSPCFDETWSLRIWPQWFDFITAIKNQCTEPLSDSKKHALGHWWLL